MPRADGQNGNLINTASLRQYLDADAHRHVNTSSDSELMLNIFADNLQKTNKMRCVGPHPSPHAHSLTLSINEEDIFTALRDMMATCSGAYACVAMLAGFGIIAFRDPNGIRPLGIATRPGARGGTDYLSASESVVAQGLGFGEWSDVLPGEAVIITRQNITRRVVAPGKAFAPDIFEHVYFARPDSTIDGISVYRARMRMGELLAETAKRELAKAGVQVDVVIPVPDTSRVAALQLAQHLGIPYREGFVKNRYVGRTFIMPGQSER
jgi:amidophosphoribosyltransferase